MPAKKHISPKTAETASKVKHTTFRDVFDALMEQFAPELTSESALLVDQLYPNETSEQRAARYARYARAFEDVELHFAALAGVYKNELLSFKTQVLSRAKSSQAKQDADTLSDLDRAIGDA